MTTLSAPVDHAETTSCSRKYGVIKRPKFLLTSILVSVGLWSFYHDVMLTRYYSTGNVNGHSSNPSNKHEVVVIVDTNVTTSAAAANLTGGQDLSNHMMTIGPNNTTIAEQSVTPTKYSANITGQNRSEETPGATRTGMTGPNITTRTTTGTVQEGTTVDSNVVLKRRRCLVFYHIPKVGGMSTQAVLKPIFSGYLKWSKLSWYSENFISKTSYAPNFWHMGHVVPPHFANKTQTENCITMTTLREPIDRVISALYYHKRKPDDWNTCLSTNKRPAAMTLRDALCPTWCQYQNDMVRLFSGLSTTWSSYNIQEYCSTPVHEQAYQNAVDFAIRQLDFVCYMEDLEQCALVLAQSVGIVNYTRQETQVVHANVNRFRPRMSLSSEIMERLGQVNSFDIRFYQELRRQRPPESLKQVQIEWLDG